MSGLPDQDRRINYSKDDVQHIVAREMAKQQIEHIQNGLLETNKKLVEIITAFNLELKNVRETLSGHPEKVDACKVSLREEVIVDHPTRIEVLTMERDLMNKINAVSVQVDKQWLKITMTITTMSVLITTAGVVMNYFLLIKKVIG